MKKIFVLLFLCAGSLGAQNYDHKWSVGVHGGFMQYRGDLGNGFYRFSKAFYGHGGVSLSRYLNRHWDASLLVTRGVVGFWGTWNEDPSIPTHFLNNITTFNLLGRYNFLHEESWMRPYITGGLGIFRQSGSGDSYVDRGKAIDYAFPEIGVGLKFQFGKFLGLQLQELFMYNGFDDIDFVKKGMNDQYLLHTIGITCNLGKLGKLGPSEPTGVGDKIDKCPKMKQHRNKVSKNESKKLKKERRENRKLSRRTKGGFFSRIFKRKDR